MISQLRILVGLRFQMLRNRIKRHATSKMTAILVSVIGIIVMLTAAGFGVAMFFLTTSMPSAKMAGNLLIAADGMCLLFIFVWFMGIFAEIARDDPIDLRRMLYLPVSLKGVFLLNSASSLFRATTAYFAFGALGCAIGFAMSMGPRMLLMLPLAAAYLLLIAAWTYCLQGVLTALMENKRRKRFLLTVIPLSIVLLGQAPNLLNMRYQKHRRQERAKLQQLHQDLAQDPENERLKKTLEEMSRRRRDRAALPWLRQANAVVPLGWLPLGISELERGRYGRSVLTFVGMLAGAAAGLALGYRSTLRHYLGRGKPRRHKRKAMARNGGLAELALPLLHDETAAIATETCLTMLRIPSLRVQLLSSFAMSFVFLLILILHVPAEGVASILRATMAPFAAFAFSTMSLGMVMNCIGMDYQGFHAMTLSPMSRTRFIRGRLLGLIAIALAIGWVLVAATCAFSRSGWRLTMVLLILVPQVQLAHSIVGGFVSILFPYRIHHDAMRRAKLPASAVLLGILWLFLLPLTIVPPAVCMLFDTLFRDTAPAWLSVGIVCAFGLTALTGVLHYSAMTSMGPWLATREKRILARLEVQSTG